MLTLDRIYNASLLLKDIARKTDLLLSTGLAADFDLFLKAENLQTTGSFKIRGSFYKIAQLSKEEKAKGVIACSAGNHAQGVALAAHKNNIKSTIFLPGNAPISKVEATRRYGAQIKLVDGVFDDAYDAAVKYQKETGAIFVHPFDDENIIAGQGTIGLEILEQLPDVDAVIVPIGGGGLISGIAYAVKNLKPNCKIYGVQATGAASMLKSIDYHKRSPLQSVSTIADGIAIKYPGEMTYELCSKYVDQFASVSEDEIAMAILSLMEKQKIVAEGAGAVSVAAAMFNKFPLKGKKVCAVISGGNIDVNILSRVINRALAAYGRLTSITVELLDKPGRLKDVLAIIAKKGANVIEVEHNRQGDYANIIRTCINISMETKNHQHLADIKKALTDKGYILLDNC
ncbi:MAG: threonine ammonia-lyase [Eubacteriaceae bacterium]